MWRMNYHRLSDRLRKQEGDRDLPYDDATGNPFKRGDTLQGTLTIGIGHSLAVPLPTEIKELLFKIDQQFAVEQCALLYPNWQKIPSEKQTVLAEMMFNLGPGTMRAFKRMRVAILNEDWQEAAAECLDSKAARQLQERYKYIAEVLGS
jgi:GH24 family phage-related lysozyme (muramidase)